MDRSKVSAAVVGNEFYVPNKSVPRGTAPAPVQRAVVAPMPRPIYEQPIARAHTVTPITVNEPKTIAKPVLVTTTHALPTLSPALTLRPALPVLPLKPLADLRLLSLSKKAVDALHNHSIIAFSLLVLLVGSTGISVYGSYRNAAIESQMKPSMMSQAKAPSIAGLNAVVPAAELDAKVQAITTQSATLTVGDQASAISPDTIRSWLQITPAKNASPSGIHINSAAITKTVTELATKYEKTTVSQISSTSGGSTQIIASGRNGAKLSNPDSIKQQTTEIAKTLLDAKGFAFTTPLETVPFQAVTPAAFTKMIEINVNSKQMYLYDSGQLTHTYPISAGAAETPTPIGQYKIFSKLPVQDMSGLNPNGSKYFQPHVRWINYFLPGGYAIHGNYWRPTSWFGNINSSHGCASLPDEQAKEVYDWAPMGTPVITHE